MTKKIHNMAIFIEFLAGSGLALFFHLALHHTDAALIIFGTGILLSVATYLLREEIDQTRQKLMDKYDHAHEVTFAIAKITDPECHSKAHEVMASAKRTMVLLQQGYIPLDETEFYMKGAKYLDESRRQVKVVDPLTTGWESKGVLINYYQANLRALDRGVRITRIFVMGSREELSDPTAQKVILNQLHDGIEVRIAYRDELPAASDISGRDTASSFDFAIYDDLVATEVFSQPGKYFGRKTREPAHVGNYQLLFDLIDHSAHAVAADDDRIILAADLLSLAS